MGSAAAIRMIRWLRVAAAGALLLLGFSCSEKANAWKALPLGTKADFRDVFFADAQHGWIAGGEYNIAGGLIGRTSDGGTTWVFSSGMLSPVQQADGLKFEALHFFDARRGVAASDGGKIFVTSDGGENWGDVRAWSGATDYLFDLEFLNDRTGWAIGLAGVLKTTDGGNRWVTLAKETKEGKVEGRAIDFVDANRGFVVGQHARAMRSTDGGRTWMQVELPLRHDERPDFWDVFFVDEREGWISGEEGTLLHTADGGITWTHRDLGIPGVRSAPKLERIRRGNRVDVIDAGDRTPGLTLAEVDFVDARRGWIAGFFANHGKSLILRTIDGGVTWTIDGEIEGEELRCLFALDENHVWAIGARTQPGTQAIYFRDPGAK